MSWKPAFWLLVIVLLTGLFIAVFERGAEPAPRSLPGDTAVLHANPTVVTRLSYAAPGVSLECALQDGEWRLVKPLSARADAARINRIVGSLCGLRRQEIIDADRREQRGLTFASFGLETPRARFVIGTELRADELCVGDNAPLGDEVYVRVNGAAEVIGASGRIDQILPLDPESLVDTRVFPASARQAVRLEIRHAAGFVQVAMRDGVWHLQLPIDARADAARVEELLQSLASLTIEPPGGGALSGGTPVALSGDDVAVQVSLWTEAAREPMTLTVGHARQDNPEFLTARVSGMERACSIRAGVLALQRITPESLRDRRLCDSDASQMASVSLREGDAKLLLSRQAGGEWFLAEPLRFAANGRAVGSLIRAIGRMTGDEVRLAAATNILPPEVAAMTASLVVSNTPGASAGTNDVSAPPPAVWSFRMAWPDDRQADGLVFREETRTLYRVRREDLSRLGWHGGRPGMVTLADPLPYMDCRMLDLNPAQTKRVTVNRQGSEETVTVNADGLWVAESPPDAQALGAEIAALLEMASRLRAERVESLSSTNAAAYGLGGAGARVTFGLSGGGIQKTVLIGSPNGRDGVYAMIQGQDVVFVIDPGVAGALLRPLVKLP